MQLSQDWSTILLVYLAVCCVVPVVLILIAAALAVRAGYATLSGVINPDPQVLQRDFERLQAQNPNVTREELVRRIIRQTSMRAGLVGLVTGLGGFITLFVALPIDIYASLRLQAAMVTFIAYAYGHTQVSTLEQQATSYLVMTGSRRAAEASVGLAVRVAGRVFGKALSKLIPVIGALTSFAVNYTLTRAIGRIAVERYSGGYRQLGGQLLKRLPGQNEET